MKISIMQPYLFPYLGYFSLIKNTDFFVFFDTPQYIRKGWINRNRILSDAGKDIYFTVPVEKTSRETSIMDVRISYKEKWIDRIHGQLSFYKKRAPYYNDVVDLIDEVIKTDNGYISNLAINSIIDSCKYIGIPLKYEIYSENRIDESGINKPDDWALMISKAKGYSVYINPPGGKSFFDTKKYKDNGIDLFFLSQKLKKYNQKNGYDFIPGLSVIDVMMFCSPKEIIDMMNDYVIE